MTVIGEETGGGANPGPSYRVGSHFEAFIPVGRSINPVTNENWEGRGVIPDIQLTGELALNGAYAMSLREIVSDEGSISQVLVEEAEKTLEVLSEG